MWDFIVRVVCERECEDLRHHWRSKEFSRVAREKTSREVKPCAQHMIGMRKVMTDGDSWFSRVKPSREIPAKHSVLPFCHSWYIRSLPTLYIPTLPTYWKEYFQRENPSHNPWELEIVLPTILYTIHCGFPQLLHLHLHIQILEKLIAQTFTTPILSVKWGFGALVGKHWKKPFVW